MKKACVENMEIGNLIFGHSRGNYQIPRDKYQDLFVNWLEEHGFDSYGCPASAEREQQAQDGWFETDVFILRPYYWGEDETIAALPNFVFKPENITISWYKYPMRDAYCSHNLPLKQFRAILNACSESLS